METLTSLCGRWVTEEMRPATRNTLIVSECCRSGRYLASNPKRLYKACYRFFISSAESPVACIITSSAIPIDFMLRSTVRIPISRPFRSVPSGNSDNIQEYPFRIFHLPDSTNRPVVANDNDLFCPIDGRMTSDPNTCLSYKSRFVTKIHSFSEQHTQ